TNKPNTTAPNPSPALVAEAIDKSGGIKENIPAPIDTVESNARYLAYLARYRTLVTASSRYLAYTSDVGEAFRPIIKPAFVTATYAISWMYLAGDVSWEGYKAWKLQKDPSTVGGMMAKRAIFQGVASMLLPALTIHSVVKHSAKVFQKSSAPAVRAWGPTVLGLAVVPALPFLFDHPTEMVVDKVWEYGEEKFFDKKKDEEKTPALFPGDPRYSGAIAEKAKDIVEIMQDEKNTK
ncbi:hypothetical protein PROFUN_15064, partial [Planoprotostelium fungivorum]